MPNKYLKLLRWYESSYNVLISSMMVFFLIWSLSDSSDTNNSRRCKLCSRRTNILVVRTVIPVRWIRRRMFCIMVRAWSVNTKIWLLSTSGWGIACSSPGCMLSWYWLTNSATSRFSAIKVSWLSIGLGNAFIKSALSPMPLIRAVKIVMALSTLASSACTNASLPAGTLRMSISSIHQRSLIKRTQ